MHRLPRQTMLNVPDAVTRGRDNFIETETDTRLAFTIGWILGDPTTPCQGDQKGRGRASDAIKSSIRPVHYQLASHGGSFRMGLHCRNKSIPSVRSVGAS